jgi:ADP-ribose pyrophosphatase YjhB (NUDIX family)
MSRREYPEVPRVGVGAVVLHKGQVLLVRRAANPSPGKWSLPGGLVELGESTIDAVKRELKEECAVDIQVVDVCGVITRVIRDAEDRIRYHYVLVDYLALVDSEAICAGDDAAEAQWVEVGRVHELETTDGLMDMIERAVALLQRCEAAPDSPEAVSERTSSEGAGA